MWSARDIVKINDSVGMRLQRFKLGFVNRVGFFVDVFKRYGRSKKARIACPIRPASVDSVDLDVCRNELCRPGKINKTWTGRALERQKSRQAWIENAEKGGKIKTQETDLEGHIRAGVLSQGVVLFRQLPRIKENHLKTPKCLCSPHGFSLHPGT